MRRNTSHRLSYLMFNQRANSPMEAQVWTKIAKKVFNLKLKLTNRVLTVLLLQKLHFNAFINKCVANDMDHNNTFI